MNTTDALGELMHAQLLAALIAGKSVRVVGTNLCPAAGVEELRRIEVKN
ncbi:MAG: hypothetical protein MK096_00630 [Oleiphilaceae bacterium]|nr:hypothetical protein [Oleiphilaceae bacterium]